jgi:hypothetical protein
MSLVEKVLSLTAPTNFYPQAWLIPAKINLDFVFVLKARNMSLWSSGDVGFPVSINSLRTR